MLKIYLVLFYLFLFVTQSFQVEVSLAPGLSLKNLFLYALLGYMVMLNNRDQTASAYKPSITSPTQKIKSLHFLFALLFFYSLVSMLFVVSFMIEPSYDLKSSVILLKTNIVDRYLFLLVFFYAVSTVKEAKWVLKWVLVITVLGNFLTIIDALNIPDLGVITQRKDGRVNGPIGESNQYGAYLVLFIPVTVYAILMYKGLWRYFFGFGAFIAFGCLLLTTSRGAIIGLAGGVTLITIYLWPVINKRYLLTTFVVFSIMAFFAILIIASQTDGLLTERFINQSGGYGSNARSISSGRSEIWGKALQKMTSSPVSYFSGFGWWSWHSSDGMARLYENVTAYNMAPHNSYLIYFFELGIIGLGLFLGIFFQVFRIVRASILREGANEIGLGISFLYGLGAILGALFFVDLYNPWVYVWAYMGICLKVACIDNGESKNDNDLKEGADLAA